MCYRYGCVGMGGIPCPALAGAADCCIKSYTQRCSSLASYIHTVLVARQIIPSATLLAAPKTHRTHPPFVATIPFHNGKPALTPCIDKGKKKPHIPPPLQVNQPHTYLQKATHPPHTHTYTHPYLLYLPSCSLPPKHRNLKPKGTEEKEKKKKKTTCVYPYSLVPRFFTPSFCSCNSSLSLRLFLYPTQPSESQSLLAEIGATSTLLTGIASLNAIKAPPRENAARRTTCSTSRCASFRKHSAVK